MKAKKIYVSHDGQDGEFCGTFAAPCESIKYAVANRSSQGDHIMISGRIGKKRDSFEEWGISLNHMLTIEGFNGKPVIKCSNSSIVFKIERSKAIFKNLELKFHLSEFASAKDELKQTIAILCRSCTAIIKNCHFRRVPVALHSVCHESCKINATDNIFESQYEAIIVEDIGRCGCGIIQSSLLKNKFIGQPSYSKTAIRLTSLYTNPKMILLHSQRWNIFIDSSIFTYFSGAIKTLVKGNLRFRIMNSDFRHQYMMSPTQMSQSAFSLNQNTLKDQWQRSVIIVNCTFFNNTSYGGAAISIHVKSWEYAKLQIIGSMFKSNTAMYDGGAISLGGDVIMTAEQSTFHDNYCGFAPFPERHLFLSPALGNGKGGALYFSRGPHSTLSYAAISNCLFKNNTAELLGGCIYADQNILLSNVYMEYSQYKQDRHILPSQISSNLGSVLRNVTIKMINSTSNGDVANFGVGYKPVKIDDTSKFVCSKGSLLRYRTLSLSPHHEQVVSINQSIRSYSFRCEICPPDFYSLHDSILQNWSLTVTKCMHCSSGGQCRFGDIKAKNNFWGYEDINTGKVKFIQLPRGYGCSKEDCATYDACAPHREGTLCGTCKKGYSESVFSAKCMLNKKCQRVKFWLITVFTSVLFLILMLYKQEITKFLKSQFAVIRKQQQQRKNHDDRNVALITDDAYVSNDEYLYHREQFQQYNNVVANEEEDSDVVTGFLKITFYFYQIDHVLRAYSHEVESKILRGFGHSVGSFFNFEFFMGGREDSATCAFFDTTPIWKIAIRISLVAIVLATLVVIFIFFKIYQRLRDKLRRRSDSSFSVNNKGEKFVDRLLMVTFEIIVLSYAVITKAIFNLLTCVEVDDKQVLFIQGSIQCYQPWQTFLKGIGLCWVVPFCLFALLLPSLIQDKQLSKKGTFFGIAFPMLFLFYIGFKRYFSNERQGQRNLAPSNSFMDSIQRYISGPFKSKHKHQTQWEGVYLVRRLILVSLNTFVRDQIYKLYSMLLLQVLFLIHHVCMKPFKNKLLNVVETISLTALIMLNCVKTFAVYDAKHGLHEEGADLLLLKIFAWTELVLVLSVPVVIVLTVGALIIARLATGIFKLSKHLYHCLVELTI